jgi:MacB-like periplasmic core domain
VISRLRALWNNVFRRKQLDRDLDEELQAYVELVSAEKAQTGVEPEEAHRYARRQTGGIDQVVQSVRDVRAGVWLDRLVQDVQYGVRTLAKNPTFSLVAVGTLALGIGANTAMFSLLDQVVLRLLPVKEPEHLVIVTVRGNNYGNSFGDNDVSYPMYEDLRDRNQAFSGMFCRFPTSVTLGVGNHAARIDAELVSGSYFPVQGVNAALGRTITPSDDRVPDGHPVAMLSYSFWRSYFHADRSILGRTISLNGYAMTVIGVARPGFDGVELGNPAKVVLADRVLLRIYLPADAAAEFVVSPIPDGRVLAFVVGAMLLTSLVFGLLPAVRGSRTEITLSLKDRSGALSAGGISLRRMLVGIQVALSLLLLVGAGLFVRTLRNLESLEPGFPPIIFLHSESTLRSTDTPTNKPNRSINGSTSTSKPCPVLLRLDSPPCRF